jgi:type VI secretion system protein ImpB
VPAESIHQKLQRVRRPHVHIKYEVETGGAMEVKELPFVMGVMGDFSGDGLKNMKPLRDRNFTEINRDNFNAILTSLQPSLTYKVDDVLTGGEGEPGQIGVNLNFRSLDDFSPAGVAMQIPELKKLLEMRDRLTQLKVQMDNPKLERELDQLIDSIRNETGLKEVASAMESGTEPEPQA